jgi:hypothetical protein
LEIYRPRLIEALEYGELVTFTPNKNIPIYNWFYFKEGFSREFVLRMMDKFEVGRGDWILDPFMGVGTTLLGCRERGVDGIGIEINPLFYFIANVKLGEYDIEELKKWRRWLFSQKFQRPSLRELPPLIRKAFNRYNLEDIIFFRDKIYEIDNRETANFFLLALMRAASKVTYAYKDGAVIKIIKKPTPPFRPFFRRIVKRMIRDLKKIKFLQSNVITQLGDARQMKGVPDEHIDLVITSPPYLNKIEYTKVYEIEMKLFLGDRAVNPIRSYIGLKPRKRPRGAPKFLLEMDMPPIALDYFIDIWKTLRELYRVLKAGGKVALVVAEGIFPDRIVESDIIISNIAYELGFKIPYIWVVNRRIATRDRTIKIGVARESIVFMEK